MMRVRRIVLSAVALAVHAALQNVAFAQESSTASEAIADITLEEITVTGSRIKRGNYSLPAPLMSISRDDIETVGSNDLTDAILEIPSVVAGVSQTNATSNLQNAGLSSVDLRNLDDNRTLVLIDGRRAVSNSANGNRVSLGTIPSGFVERVEVITGGASAVYGSDAVAGVVNIITKRNQEGWELDFRAGDGRDGAFDDQTVDISYGGKYARDKGTFFAGLNYDTESGIRVADVPSAQLQADWRYRNGRNQFRTQTGFRDAADVTQADFADLSSDPDGGRFNGNDFWFDDNGLRTGFVSGRDGFDFRADDDFLIPRDRINVALATDYQFESGMRGFATLLFSDIETDNLREPEGDDWNDLHTLFDPVTGTNEFITSGRISRDNPFVPAEIRADSSSRGITWDRRFVEVGAQRTLNDRETIRFSAGLEGEVLSNWNWEASIGYGRYEQNQTRFNEINILNLREGLNAEVGDNGQIQCANAAARAAGCVPVNLFGRGSISPEAANYIRANLGLESTIEQVTLSAFMTGTVGELPAGSVDAVIGFEYRDDSLDLSPGALNRLGGHSSNFVPAFTGSTDVAELFAELSVPLASTVNLDLSARHADYSIDNVGGVTSFGAGLQWNPLDSLNFRGSFNRALRAPDLAELFSPPRGDSDSFDDICEDVTLTTPGRIAANCRSDAGVLANILENGAFEDESRSKFSPNSGNLSLKEETAETFTFGVVIQPESIADLQIAVDYYKIEIEDAIDSFSNDDILEQCFDSNTFGPSNPFCREISRDSDGQISQLIQRQQNLDSIETSGIDLTFNYKHSFERIPGEFSFSYVHSYIDKYESVSQGSEGLVVTDLKGDLDAGNIENRSRFRLSWSNDDWKVRWTTRFFGSVNDDNDLIEDFEDALADDPAAEKPIFLDIDSEFFHDLYVSYNIKSGNDNNFKVFGGIRNVFENEGPFLPDGTEGDANEGGIYRVSRGRYFFLGLNSRF